MTLSLLWLAATHDRPSAGELFLPQARSSRTTGTCTLLGLNERGEHQQYEFPCTTFDLSHSAFSGIYAMVANNCTIILDHQTLRLKLLGLDNCWLRARRGKVRIDEFVAENGSQISLNRGRFQVMEKSQIQDSYLNTFKSYLSLGKQASFIRGRYRLKEGPTEVGHLDVQYADVLFENGDLDVSFLTTRQGSFTFENNGWNTRLKATHMALANTEANVDCKYFTVLENFIVAGGKVNLSGYDVNIGKLQSMASSIHFNNRNSTDIDHLHAQTTDLAFQGGSLTVKEFKTHQGKFTCSKTNVWVENNMELIDTQTEVDAYRRSEYYSHLASAASFVVRENLVIERGKICWYGGDLEIGTHVGGWFGKSGYNNPSAKLILKESSCEFHHCDSSIYNLEAQRAAILFGGGILSIKGMATLHQGEVKFLQNHLCARTIRLIDTKAWIDGSQGSYQNPRPIGYFGPRLELELVGPPSICPVPSFKIHENLLVEGGESHWNNSTLSIENVQFSNTFAKFTDCSLVTANQALYDRIDSTVEDYKRSGKFSTPEEAEYYKRNEKSRVSNLAKTGRFFFDGSHSDEPTLVTIGCSFTGGDVTVTPSHSWRSSGTELSGSTIEMQVTAEQAESLLYSPAFREAKLTLFVQGCLGLTKHLYQPEVTLVGDVNLNEFPGTRGKLAVHTTRAVFIANLL